MELIINEIKGDITSVTPVIEGDIGIGASDIIVERLSVTENGTYTADSNHAYTPVVVDVPQIEVEPLSVSANGTYEAESGAYNPVNVNVPQTELTTLNVNANGTYEAISGTAYDEVNVNVPQGVFPSGTLPITENGTYDVTNYASTEVNVSGGETWEETLLWENPDPTVAFPETTLQIPNLSDFEYLKIKFAQRTTISDRFEEIVLASNVKNSRIKFALMSAESYYRQGLVNYTNNTITIGEAVRLYSTQTSTVIHIPTAIYGIKKGGA